MDELATLDVAESVGLDAPVQDRIAAVSRALAALGAEHGLVVCLFYFEMLTTEQIAVVLERSEYWVIETLNAALERLGSAGEEHLEALAA